MNTVFTIDFILFSLSTVIMILNLIKSLPLYNLIIISLNNNEKKSLFYYKLHVTMIALFIIGHLFMSIKSLYDLHSNVTSISVIFLLGSIFVFIGINIKKILLTTINKTYLQTIKALANAIDTRDHYTKSHSEHVANLSLLIYNNLPNYLYNNSKKDFIFYAGLLHDIGKLGVPKDILNKPGALTDEEMKIIKMHPLNSKNIVDSIDGLKPISKWILYHHERVDGNGYFKIKDGDIPLESKIICVADVYSALVTKRPYNSPKLYEDALKLMKKMCNKHLDDFIFDIFRNIPKDEVENCLPEKFLQENLIHRL